MDCISIPRLDLYVDDDHVIAEWHDDGQYRAEFLVVDVEEPADDEPETVAVFLELATVGRTLTPDPDATFDDVPHGVLLAVDQFAHRAVRGFDDEEGGNDDDRGPRERGVA